MQSNINAARIVVFLDFGGVSQLLQMLIFLKCELCDRPFCYFSVSNSYNTFVCAGSLAPRI